MRGQQIEELFDEAVLMYLYQTPTAVSLAKYVKESMFELPEHKIIFSLYASYLNKYKVPPSRIGLEYVIGKEMKEPDYYIRLVESMYRPIQVPEKQILAELINWCKKRAAMHIIETLTPKLLEGDDATFNEFYKLAGEMNSIGEQIEQTSLPIHILTDPFDISIANYEAYNSHLPGMDKLTNAGGFYSPQLVVWMSGPKSFKTGSLINLAMALARQGLKVLYIDTENGTASLRRRFYQKIARQGYSDLTAEKLKENAAIYRIQKGDVRIEYLPARVSTMEDAELLIKKAIADGFQPNAIIWDYLDNIKAKERDKRLGIQEVYFHAIYLNFKYNCFAFTPSQVNKAALEKSVFDMTDLAEDFGKAMNAHAAFALCRTPEEQDAGIGRVVPVFQREGVRLNSKGTNCVFVAIDEETQQCYEIDVETYKQKFNEKHSNNS